MEHYELENLFIRFLKGLSSEGFQIGTWRTYLEKNAALRIIQHENIEGLEIISEFLSKNIISIGSDWENKILPNFRITKYGKTIINENSWLPYDPDGYMFEFKNNVPDLDNQVYIYLSESIQAYHRDCLLSSITMLGVASECLIIEFIRVFGEWMSKNKGNDTLIKSLKESSIYKKYKVLMKSLEDNIDDIPKDLRMDLIVHFDNTFNYIRMCRNESGHPSGKAIGKRDIYAQLQAFERYAKYIKSLIDNFKI